jgi:hypothetical protein
VSTRAIHNRRITRTSRHIAVGIGVAAVLLFGGATSASADDGMDNNPPFAPASPDPLAGYPLPGMNDPAFLAFGPIVVLPVPAPTASAPASVPETGPAVQAPPADQAPHYSDAEVLDAWWNLVPHAP